MPGRGTPKRPAGDARRLMEPVIPALAYICAGWLLRAAGLSAPLVSAALLPPAAVWYGIEAARRSVSRPAAKAVPGIALRWLAAGCCLGCAVYWTARQLRSGASATGADLSALAVFAVCLAGPLGEELVYRGLVQPRAMAVMRPRWAIPVSAVLFAAGHGSPLEAALALPAGLLFGYAAYRERTLLAPVLAHAAANAVQLAGGCAAAWIGGISAAALIVLQMMKSRRKGERVEGDSQ